MYLVVVVNENDMDVDEKVFLLNIEVEEFVVLFFVLFVFIVLMFDSDLEEEVDFSKYFIIFCVGSLL